MTKTNILKVLVAISGLLFGVSSFAQKAYEEIKADPQKAYGIYGLYSFTTVSNAMSPKGYEPFYISHFGRHGARFASSSSFYLKAHTMLAKAHAAGKLTPKGEQIFHRYDSVYLNYLNRGGDLTKIGQWQQHELASRMYENYKKVFYKGAKIDAHSSNVPRCVMTMSAFCDGLKLEDPTLDISQASAPATMYYMLPTSEYNPEVTSVDEGMDNPAFVWNVTLDSLQNALFRPEDFFGRIFNDVDFVRKYGNLYDLEYSFYILVATSPCSGYADFSDIFTFDELYRVWQRDNFRFYASKGPDPRQGGRQWAFAWTLMDNILSQADQDIASGEYAARLRFGHDITIMNIMTLLNVDGWSTATMDVSKITDLWQNYRVPMASNLQFIFYRKKSNPNDIIVRFMNNEKDVLLPIHSDIAPYYNWKDLKAYCQQRIAVAKDIVKRTQPAK